MDKIEAENLLNKSREKLDIIDEKLINLIMERTSLAGDIANSKKVLNKDLLDPERESIIHERISKLIEDKDINKEHVFEIFNILFTMSKEEQKKYL
ncbi:MAG: chorismate mutase [Methanosphaera sp.]|nr:chorismate mutase [Methanosphaera sp.]